MQRSCQRVSTQRDVGPFNRREYLLLVVDRAALVCGHVRRVVRRYKQRVDVVFEIARPK